MNNWDDLSKDQYWNKRYIEKRNGWDNLQAHPYLPFVVSYLGEGLKNSSVLVIGAGPGHDAEYLSGVAKSVTALDFSTEALLSFKNYYPASTVKYKIGDFLSGSPIGKFDVVFEHTLLCAIDPRRYPDYFKSVIGHLEPNGKFAGIIWNKSPVGMDGPPFSVSNEVIKTGFGNSMNWHVESPVSITIPSRENTETFMLGKSRQ